MLKRTNIYIEFISSKTKIRGNMLAQAQPTMYGLELLCKRVVRKYLGKSVEFQPSYGLNRYPSISGLYGAILRTDRKGNITGSDQVYIGYA